MQRWKVNERLLPSGSQIDFREATAWELYRWHIVFAISLFVAQALLIMLLLHERERRQQAEVQSRQRMSELARANRFATVGELTASIAHEINQPLGAIRANAESMELMVKSDHPGMNDVRKIVADIRRNEERVSDVIVRLRNLLKKAPSELSEIDLNEVVGDTMGVLSALAIGRKVEVRRTLSHLPLLVKGDHIQLQQVVLNLIVNAMDAMSHLPVSERLIIIRSVRANDRAEVLIADRGPGGIVRCLESNIRAAIHDKSGGHGHGVIDCSNDCRGARWSLVGGKSVRGWCGISGLSAAS